MDDKNNLFKEFQSVLKNPIMIEGIDQYLSDWRGVFKGKTKFVVFPSTTQEVSKIVILANKYSIPIVPQGGNTGLVGGSVPRKEKGEIILNLKNMNNIRKINLTDNSVVIESGCILEDLKKKLWEQDMEIPLNMG